MRCKNCGKIIDENDMYCKYCGYNQKKIGNKFWESEFGIILLTLMIGPFSLFSLYKSRIISPNKKKFYAIFIVMFTLLFIVAMIMSLRILFNYYSTIFNMNSAI